MPENAPNSGIPRWRRAAGAAKPVTADKKAAGVSGGFS
jgi:hypothetical protein